MKKSVVIALFAGLLFTATSLKAQQNAIKINFLSPIFKTLNIAYEHAINENGSFQLGFYYTGFSVSDLSYKGFGITPEYRFYLSDSPAPNGFYVAPFLRYQSIKLEDTSSGSTGKADFTAFGGGLIIGRQWIFKERITFDIFIGPSYNSGKTKVTDGSGGNFDVNGSFDGFGLRTGMTIGVAF